MAFTHAVPTNSYGPAKIIVATSLANGTHTTLSAAMSDSVSGDTIFMRNSVTENVTLTPGVNIVSYVGSESTPTVSITGKLTMTGAGTCTIAGIRLTTNSDYSIVVSGSAASILNLENCYLNILNSSFINHTSSSSSSTINVKYCSGNIATTGITPVISTSAGNIIFTYSNITNSGLSITPSTISGGRIGIYYSRFSYVFSTSSTGSVDCHHSTIDVAALGLNATLITYVGTGGGVHFHTYFASGSQSSISLGTGTTMSITNCTFDCNATNVITGTGTLLYSGLSFIGASSTINVTNITRGGTLSGSKTISPTAGFLGEAITANLAFGSATALTTVTAKTVTSINLTAGVWDVTGVVSFTTNSATLVTNEVGSISTTTNTLGGNPGVDEIYNNFSGGITGIALSITIPPLRATISSSTVYFLVAQSAFTVNVSSVYGKITATRVG